MDGHIQNNVLVHKWYCCVLALCGIFDSVEILFQTAEASDICWFLY